MDKYEKLEALQNNEAFALELDKVESPEQMQALLTAHGVELTLDEVCDLVVNSVKMNGDELSAEDLENVSGGSWYWDVLKFLGKEVAKWAIKKGLDWVYDKFGKNWKK